MIDEGRKFDVLKQAITNFGDGSQTDILIEEMAELTKAIIKSRRNGGHYSTPEILEELADVQICLDQLKMIAGKNHGGAGAFADLLARYNDIKRRMERVASGKMPAHSPTQNEAATQESKAISRSDLDARIWKEWKSGKSPKEISDALCSEGYYYGEQRVRRMLMQQGVDL